jgi:hypothetical protein
VKENPTIPLLTGFEERKGRKTEKRKIGVGRRKKER